MKRGARRCAALCLAALLLAGCASRAPRPQTQAPTPHMPDTLARELIDAWQRRLADYVDTAGQGDPAVLARLPLLRATGTLRPARISFGVLDLEATRSEADGFDVHGLLLGPPDGGDAATFVFIVGIIQREGYRPVGLADLRPVTLQLQGGRLVANVGNADARALARYRDAIDPALPLRFPADQDDFALVRCDGGLCVDERLTQARWPLDH